MKKILFYSMVYLLSSIIISGCKKTHHNDDEPTPAKTLYPVTYNLSGFSVTTDNAFQNSSTKLKTNAESPQNVSSIKYLCYVLYNSAGVQISQRKFSTTDANFSPVITDKLSAGSYYAVFVTCASSDALESNGKSVKYYYLQSFPETFYKKISFTVGSDAVNQDVVLARVTAELQIVIKDAIPANATSMRILFAADKKTWLLFDGKPIPVNPYDSDGVYFEAAVELYNVFSAADAGATNFATAPVTYLNTNTNLSIIITVTKGFDDIITKREISNVILKPNTRTILTGNLFTNSSTGNGFDVSFQPVFDADGINVHF